MSKGCAFQAKKSSTVAPHARRIFFQLAQEPDWSRTSTDTSLKRELWSRAGLAKMNLEREKEEPEGRR